MGDLQSVVQSVLQEKALMQQEILVEVQALEQEKALMQQEILVEVQALEQEKALMQPLYYGQLHHPGLENDLRQEHSINQSEWGYEIKTKSV